jgi:long-subunit acyl-CoA synthetase (AMP-forming)
MEKDQTMTGNPSGGSAQAVKPGEFVVEPPTLTCLGFEWDIEGDENRSASVAVSYRKQGDDAWKEAWPLFRVQNETWVGGLGALKLLGVNADTYVAPNRFAGSVFDLDEDTEYECKFVMSDQDGVDGDPVRIVTVRTRPEPQPYPDGNVYHVYPNTWTGPKETPHYYSVGQAYYHFWAGGNQDYLIPGYRVQPGDTILVHAGVYTDATPPPGATEPARLYYAVELLTSFKAGYGNTWDGTYYLTAKGTAEKPIVIKAAGDGEVIFDGGGNAVLFDVQGSEYNYFEGITFRNTDIAILAGRRNIAGAVGLMVKRCRFEDFGYAGITTESERSRNFYIADNTFIGRDPADHLMGWTSPPGMGKHVAPWFSDELPRPMYSYYAVKVYGSGHVICYNYAANAHDAFCFSPGIPPNSPNVPRELMAVSNDFYNNDTSNIADHAIEGWGAMHNHRIFRNRCLNAVNGPTNHFGAPWYLIRNVIYHNPSSTGMASGDGAVVLHNDFFSSPAIGDLGGNNGHFLNNLVFDIYPKPIFSVSTNTNYTESDYNGFRPNEGAEHAFVWNSPPFGTLADYTNPLVQRSFTTLGEYSLATRQDRHSVLVDWDIFMGSVKPDSDPTKLYSPDELDFRLKPDSAAVDAGCVLPNINDDFTGRAPDLGAYELDRPLPHYGPRLKVMVDNVSRARGDGDAMTRPETRSWTPPNVSITQQGGDLILENPMPLADYTANLGVWLRQNAIRFPNKPFVLQRDAEGIWSGPTYAEALARVNRLSNGLVALGLDDSRPIAIMSENSVEMALVQLAAMQVGIAVVPISYAYSALSKTGGHIKHILDVIQAPLVVMSDADLHMAKLTQWDLAGLQLFAVSHAEHHDGVQPLGAVEAAGTDGNALNAEGEARFASVTPATLAKIQFTSGSTNLPKGVEVTHGMQTSNQVGIAQLWPFVGEDEVAVDFLPWNHTFGGNFIFNMLLMHGGTLHIDRGNPSPQGFDTMVKNIIDVKPTIYFGVPRSYTALYARMQTDAALRDAFFSRLKFMFTAAAALDQPTFDGMQAMSAEARGGEPIPFFAAWGMTESSPDATLVHWPTRDARVIGLPLPGVAVKLAADPSGKRELRVKGPNVTRGYYHNDEATSAAFDDEGYYRSGDAGAFLDPENPETGLLFDGRTGEDFKLTSGTWVHNARLRASINGLGQPYLLEVVIAAPNRDYLAAMVFPNLPALRGRFADASARSGADDAAFLASEDVRAFFKEVFARHNSEFTTSSGRIELVTLLSVPPQLDANETTDKGYINQIAVLTNRADMVERLFMEPTPSEVILVEDVADAATGMNPESKERPLEAPSSPQPAPAVSDRRRQGWRPCRRG